MRTKLLIVLIIVFCSCGRKGTNQTNDTTSIIVIDLHSETESKITRLSDIAKDIDYIPLQTSEKSLIKNIAKIISCENKIYIKNNVVEVMCFNNEGQFLYKLDRSGRGPGEYSYITDFDISSDNNTLLILSSGKILEFKNTGTEFTFRNSINLKRPAPSMLDIVPGTSNVLLSIDPIMGSEPSLSVIINFNGDTLNFKPNCYKYEKVDKMTTVHIWESLHYKFDNCVFFREQFSDTIFSVNSSSNDFIPRLVLDSHGSVLPPQAKGDRSYFQRHPGNNSFLYTIIEVPKYLIYSYEYGLQKYRIIFDKSINKKFEIALNDALINDISGGPSFDPDFCSENILYSTVDALTLKKYVASENFKKAQVQNPKKKEELKKLADSLEETDNPILIVVTPKN